MATADPHAVSHPIETENERDARLAWQAEAIRQARCDIEQEGGIPLEEIEAWVASWDTPDELPMPEPRK